MTGEQSRGLKVGDRVCWGEDENDQATVTEKNWSGVTLKWDNRSEQPVLHNGMAKVFLIPKSSPNEKAQLSQIWHGNRMPPCEGTGFPTVVQPAEPVRKIYPAPCKKCLGKGRLARELK